MKQLIKEAKRMQQLAGISNTEHLGERLAESDSMFTSEKLIKQAQKDGYIKGDYSQAVLSAAKKIANKYDQLSFEEQKVMRDTYYKAFLKMIGSEI